MLCNAPLIKLRADAPFFFLSRVPHSTVGLIHTNQIVACPQQQIPVWDWSNVTTRGGQASALVKELRLMVFQNDAPEGLTIKERPRRRGESQMFSEAWKTVVYHKPYKHLKSHAEQSHSWVTTMSTLPHSFVAPKSITNHLCLCSSTAITDSLDYIVSWTEKIKNKRWDEDQLC